MEIEQETLTLTQLSDDYLLTSNKDSLKMCTRTEYQRSKYENLKLATPNLVPKKSEIEIPLLEDFPEPAISLSEESSFDLADDWM